MLGIKTIEVPVVWNNVEGTKVSAFSGAASFAALVGIRGRALAGRYTAAPKESEVSSQQSE